MKNLWDTVEKISKLPGLEVEGIFTHFARADEKTIEPAREPFRKYMAFVEELEKRGVKIPIHHVSNSASIIGFSEANLDMVRSGITTYGLYPSNEVAKDVLILEPAMQWKSIISYIKTVEPGTSISYGGTFTAKEKMTVATIPVGYADGMKRDLSGKGRVLIHGQYASDFRKNLYGPVYGGCVSYQRSCNRGYGNNFWKRWRKKYPR